MADTSQASNVPTTSEPIYSQGRIIGYQQVPVTSLQSFHGSEQGGTYKGESGQIVAFGNAQLSANQAQYNAIQAQQLQPDQAYTQASQPKATGPGYQALGESMARLVGQPKPSEPRPGIEYASQRMQEIAARTLISQSLAPKTVQEAQSAARAYDVSYLAKATGLPEASITDQMLSQLGSQSYSARVSAQISQVNASKTLAEQRANLINLSESSGLTSFSVMNAPTQPASTPLLLPGQSIRYTGPAPSYQGLDQPGPSNQVMNLEGIINPTPQSRMTVVLGGGEVNPLAPQSQTLTTLNPRIEFIQPSKVPPVTANLTPNQQQEVDYYLLTPEQYAEKYSSRYQAGVKNVAAFRNVVGGVPIIGDILTEQYALGVRAGIVTGDIGDVILTPSAANRVVSAERQQAISTFGSPQFVPSVVVNVAEFAAFSTATKYGIPALGSAIDTSLSFKLPAILPKPVAYTATFVETTFSEAKPYEAAPQTAGVRNGEAFLTPARQGGFKTTGAGRAVSTTTFTQPNPYGRLFYQTPETITTETTFELPKVRFTNQPEVINSDVFVRFLRYGESTLQSQSGRVSELSYGPETSGQGLIKVGPRQSSIQALPGFGQLKETPSVEVLQLGQEARVNLPTADYTLPSSMKATFGAERGVSFSDIGVAYLKTGEVTKTPSGFEFTPGGQVQRTVFSISQTEQAPFQFSKTTIQDLVTQQRGGFTEVLYQSPSSSVRGPSGSFEPQMTSLEAVVRFKGAGGEPKIFSFEEAFPTGERGATIRPSDVSGLDISRTGSFKSSQAPSAPTQKGGSLIGGPSGGPVLQQINEPSQTQNEGIAASVIDFAKSLGESQQARAQAQISETQPTLPEGATFGAAIVIPSPGTTRQVFPQALSVQEPQIRNIRQIEPTISGLRTSGLSAQVLRTSPETGFRVLSVQNNRVSDFIGQNLRPQTEQFNTQQTRVGLDLSFGQAQQSLRSQLEAQPSGVPIPTTPFEQPPPTPPPIIPPIIPPIFPPLALPTEGPRKPSGRTKKPKSQYQPSFTAISLNLRGPTAKEFRRGQSTGLGLRLLPNTPKGPTKAENRPVFFDYSKPKGGKR